MRFSLIVATHGRVQELHRLFQSLTRQEETDFEVILVDQNPPELLADVVERFRPQLSLLHVASPLGVSRARNVGLRRASGEIVAFPDDDCWYQPDTLRRWSEAYCVLPDAAGVMGRTLGPDGEAIHGMTQQHASPISRRNVWRCTNGNVLSFRREAFDVLAGFDETLGPGAGTPWGACEDAELPIRALDAGLTLYYEPKISIRHPNPRFSSFAPGVARRRALHYGRGMGRVLRMRRFGLSQVASALIRPAGGAVLSLLRGQWQSGLCYAINGYGRWQGWLARPSTSPVPPRITPGEWCALENGADDREPVDQGVAS